MKIKCCVPCYQDNTFELGEGDSLIIVNEAICEISQNIIIEGVGK